jgi:hypothetical protein
LIASVAGVGMIVWRKHPIDERREMSLDEFEFARDQRILG